MTNLAPAAPEWRRQLAAARARRDYVSDEFLATIARITASNVSQAAIAEELHSSQPQVSRWAARGRELLEKESESGAGRTPYQAAERYQRGELTREELIDALAHWDYVDWNSKTTGLHDDLLVTVSGSFDDVLAALDDGLIDEEIYEIVYGRLEAARAHAR